MIEVTQAVCESLLGDYAEPRPATSPPPPPSDDDLVAWVTISGAWTGKVAVRLSPALATRLAREIMEVDPHSTDDLEVRDVAGEVANMIGGNLKALLPEPCRLSLPKVSHERPSSEEEEGVVQRFAIGADTFEVTVKSAA
ncbi:MAG: chemotaxis protein CheX [Sandaracinaceae bacterium]|nr:chemotaxis protein CheX [Sandaracinaceae bacterium]